MVKITTLVYSPSVQVHIATSKSTQAKPDIIDVTADLSNVVVTRAIGAVSGINFTILNAQRKYDGVFSPMDRVVCYMKRIRGMLVFSGYIDTVPAFQAFPGSIRISGSCTLKRLQYFYWDPTTIIANSLFQQDTTTISGDLSQGGQDGGMSLRSINLLNKVAGWPKEQIHIGRVPNEWFDAVASVADAATKEADLLAMAETVGTQAYTNGVTPAGVSTVIGAPPGGGILPATSGRCSDYGGGPLTANIPASKGGRATPNDPGAHGQFGLTNEQYPNYRDMWYCAMRFQYVGTNARGMPDPPTSITTAAAKWWRGDDGYGRRLLVVNPENNKACVVRAADWGPRGDLNRVIDLSSVVMEELGTATDKVVNISFAGEDQPLGPVDTTRPSNAAQTGQILVDTGVAFNGWGNPNDPSYQQLNIVHAKGGGCDFYCNSTVVNRFTGFLNDLVSVLGYQPSIVEGYNHRVIAGTHTESNHSFGAAIDIDPDRSSAHPHGNPYTKGVALHDIPDSVVPIARKWGLGWGGEWHSAKDYMHFEILDAPQSPWKTTYGGADPHREIEMGQTPTGGTGTTGSVSYTLSSDAMGAAPVGMSDPIDALFNVSQWLGTQPGGGGEYLGGPRALANDVPILGTLRNYLSASMREFCSAPNGDLIAWFPDYFGWFGTAGKIVVSDVELMRNFVVAWSDIDLKTHQFVTGSTSGEEGLGDAATIEALEDTAGIVSVEMSAVRNLLNLPPSFPWGKDGKAFLSRFGARPDLQQMDNLFGGPGHHRQEFFMAMFLFLRNWSQQFSASVDVTFMPEVWPGMLMQFPTYGVQGYVTEVTHQCDLQAGGGFTTRVTLTAWSSIGTSTKVPGLPVGGPRSFSTPTPTKKKPTAKKPIAKKPVKK